MRLHTGFQGLGKGLESPQNILSLLPFLLPVDFVLSLLSCCLGMAADAYSCEPRTKTMRVFSNQFNI